LLKKFADLSKKNAGEFYTPRSVVKLLVKILAPKPGETVYDIIMQSLIQFNFSFDILPLAG
jgi:type I restriction-modification system DNA methylase subunit